MDTWLVRNNVNYFKSSAILRKIVQRSSDSDKNDTTSNSLTGCQASVYASTASFSSPGYPIGYPNLLSCEFTVMADEPLVAVFDSNFEIKPGDSLKVSNSTGFLHVFYFLSSSMFDIFMFLPNVLLSQLNLFFLIIFFENILTYTD